MPSAREHLERLAARPRPAGSPAEAEARAWCEEVLAAHGFAVAREPFEYSALPGRLASPLLGVAAVLALWAAAWSGWHQRPGAALVLLIAFTAVSCVVIRWLARDGVLRIRWWRAASTNLVAVRGGPSPTLWLVAHLDSKSQPIPIATRAAGIVLLNAFIALAVLLALIQWLGLVHVEPRVWAWLADLCVIPGFAVAASTVDSRSPGAVDNASGVATVLRVAELAPASAALGVVITSAEELGLAGARAWVKGRAPAAAVNIDSIDDTGRVRLMYAGARSRALAGAVSESLGGARAGRILAGVLVDGVAFADAGWAAVTVSRGTYDTLMRIHTPRDSLGVLWGMGVEEVAQRLAALVG